MRNTLLKIGLVAFSFFSTATAFAYDFHGKMKVNESIELKGKFHHMRTVQPGTYSAYVDVHSILKHVTLRLNHKSYRFKFDSDTHIPTIDGEVTLRAEDNGQQYDLKFKAKTKHWVSKPYTRFEPCYWGYYYYGTRRVVYHNEVADHFYMLNFNHPAGKSAAVLKGKRSDVNAVIEKYGRCRI